MSAAEPLRHWRRGAPPASVAYRPPVYTAAEFNVRNQARQNSAVHVQAAQNEVMLEQDRLMDAIARGAVLLSDSDDEVLCAPPAFD